MKRIRTIADAICLIMIIGYAVFVGTSEKIGEKTKMYIPWKGSEILFGNKIIFLSSAMIAIVLWGVLSLVLFYNMLYLVKESWKKTRTIRKNYFLQYIRY